MVMAALTALKSTNCDFGIVLISCCIFGNCAVREVEPHPDRILSAGRNISRGVNMPILACPKGEIFLRICRKCPRTIFLVKGACA